MDKLTMQILITWVMLTLLFALIVFAIEDCSNQPREMITLESKTCYE